MAIDVNDPRLKKRKKKVASLNAQTQTQRRPIRTGPKGGVRQGGRKRLPGGRAAAPQLNAPTPPPTTRPGIPPTPQPTAPPPAPQTTAPPPAPQTTAPPPAPETTAPPPAPETTVDPGTQAQMDVLTEEINALLQSNPFSPRLIELLRERDELQAKGEARQAAFDQEERFRQQLLEQQPAEFEALSSRFSEGLQIPLGNQLAGAQARFSQQLGRSGLSGSGLEAAGNIALSQASQIQFAQSLGEFQNQLALAQQQEVSLTRQGGYDYIRGVENFFINFNFEKKLIEFQNKIASNRDALDRLFQLGEVIGRVALAG